MTRNNILITSAGAKVLLVQAFKAAERGRVHTADTGADCAAHHFSDRSFQVRRTDDPRGADELFDICLREQIGLIVPTRDGELPFFATHQQQFLEQGTRVLVAAPGPLAICQDKRRFAEFLQAEGLPGLPEFEPGGINETQYPLFIRPVTGAGGRGIMRIETAAQLAAVRGCDDMLIHPFIDAPEYSIDLLMDLQGGSALQAVCRQRLHVVGGEAKISKITPRDDLTSLAMTLGEKLELVGHNVVQLFDDPVRGPLFIEVNPRFGGASNLSIKAGLDSPARLLALMAGDESARQTRAIKNGLTMLRYSQDVFMEQEE